MLGSKMLANIKHANAHCEAFSAKWQQGQRHVKNLKRKKEEDAFPSWLQLSMCHLNVMSNVCSVRFTLGRFTGQAIRAVKVQRCSEKHLWHICSTELLPDPCSGSDELTAEKQVSFHTCSYPCEFGRAGTVGQAQLGSVLVHKSKLSTSFQLGTKTLLSKPSGNHRVQAHSAQLD